MRSPIDVMLRWWNFNSLAGNGESTANGETAIAPADTPAVPKPTPTEAPWLAQLDREGIPRSLHYPSTTLGRIIDQAADRFGDNTAIVYNSSVRWTYRELLARVNR